MYEHLIRLREGAYAVEDPGLGIRNTGRITTDIAD